MAIFKPYKITSSQLETLPITEGQFIVTTDTNKIYLDESASNRIELIPVPTKTSDLVNDMNFMSGMTILAYGKSTWNDFITAYTAKHVVYTRASSSSNPASGSQTRMAFMAYVNNETDPTEVEFQYYRSVSSHSDSQQGDQTYVYKLNKTNGWSVTVRENYTKVVAGTGMSSTGSGGKITLNATNNGTVTQVTAGTGLTTGQTSADITSTGTLSLDTSGVTAGTYQGLTVDSYGRVTSASNQNYEQTTNKTTSISEYSTDTQYPSAKAIYTAYGQEFAIPYEARPTSLNCDKTIAYDSDQNSLFQKLRNYIINGGDNKAYIYVQLYGETSYYARFPIYRRSDAEDYYTACTPVLTLQNSTGVIYITPYGDSLIVSYRFIAGENTLNVYPTIDTVPATKKYVDDNIPTVPTKVSDLTNDSGYITGITSSDVTTALGYTPYDSTNPNGYTTNTGTITGITMNGTSKGTSGVVDLGTVLTSYTETDPIYSASAASGITSSDITNWNNKTSNTGTITGVSVNGTSVATSGIANITSVPASILTGAIPSAVTATTQSQGDNSTKIATTAYVDTAIDNLPEPMVFKGSLGTGGTITSLPTNGTANIGDTYKVITAGTYASKSADVGDTFICLTKTSSANTGELIPSGDEPSGTVTSITLNATSPINIDSSSAITTSGTRTLSHANSGVTAGTYKSVTVNATGHVTAGTNPTTLSGYGITDANINNGTITLGNNTITPLTTSYDYIIPSIDVYPSESLTGTITDSNVISVLSDIHSNARHNTLRIGLGIYDESDGTSHFATNISYEDTTQPLTFMYTYGITYIITISYVGYQSATYTIQKIENATDTKNTAGTTNTTNKIYLAGATEQSDNPQTYSNVNCYASGGKLYSNAKEVVNLSDTQALTNKTYNGYTLAAASAKAVDTSITTASTSTNLPTSQAVANFVEGKGYITSYTETDPVFTASAAYGITSTNITNWNGKQNQILSGTTDPSNSLGVNGDVYIKYSIS